MTSAAPSTTVAGSSGCSRAPLKICAASAMTSGEGLVRVKIRTGSVGKRFFNARTMWRPTNPEAPVTRIMMSSYWRKHSAAIAPKTANDIFGEVEPQGGNFHLKTGAPQCVAHQPAARGRMIEDMTVRNFVEKTRKDCRVPRIIPAFGDFCLS